MGEGVGGGVGGGEKRKRGKEEKRRHDACRRCHVTTAGGQSLLHLPRATTCRFSVDPSFHFLPSLPQSSPDLKRISRPQTNLPAQTPQPVVEPKFAHKLPDACPCESSLLGPSLHFAKDDRSLDQLEIGETVGHCDLGSLSLLCWQTPQARNRMLDAQWRNSNSTSTSKAQLPIPPPHLSETRPKETKENATVQDSISSHAPTGETSLAEPRVQPRRDNAWVVGIRFELPLPSLHREPPVPDNTG